MFAFGSRASILRLIWRWIWSAAPFKWDWTEASSLHTCMQMMWLSHMNDALLLELVTGFSIIRNMFLTLHPSSIIQEICYSSQIQRFMILLPLQFFCLVRLVLPCYGSSLASRATERRKRKQVLTLNDYRIALQISRSQS